MAPWKLSHLLRVATFGFVVLAVLNIPNCQAQQPATKPIRVALYAGEGATIKSLPEILTCLSKSDGFDVAKIKAEEIRRGSLADFDVVIFPGGSGSGEGEALGTEGRDRVREFVKHGGGYIGICAGAYLASIEYPWSLGVLNAHVLDRAHWDRGEGNVNLKIADAGKDTLRADGDTCAIHYENGPLLGPGEKKDLADYELLASYDTEMTQNAPAGTMKGTAAIARGKFGDGRVFCFSPHPEKTAGRAAFLQSAVHWVADRDEAKN